LAEAGGLLAAPVVGLAVGLVLRVCGASLCLLLVVEVRPRDRPTAGRSAHARPGPPLQSNKAHALEYNRWVSAWATRIGIKVFTAHRSPVRTLKSMRLVAIFEF